MEQPNYLDMTWAIEFHLKVSQKADCREETSSTVTPRTGQVVQIIVFGTIARKCRKWPVWV